VIWEDGEITKVPHDQVRYTYPQRAPYGECFPGQAGVPKQTYTYEDRKSHILPLNKDGSNPNVEISDEAAKTIKSQTQANTEKIL
jgi:hypothetical protein